jgi:hypothetical protein
MEKRKRGRPSLNGAKITFTIPGALLKRLDDFRAESFDCERRADALRLLVEAGLDATGSSPARSGEGQGQ